MALFGAHLNANQNCSRKTFFFLVGILLTLLSNAQTVITTISTNTTSATSSTVNTTSPSDAGNQIIGTNPYDLLYGQGNDISVDSYEVSSITYENFLRPDTLVLNRREANDRLVNIWYTLNSINTASDPDQLLINPTPTTDADAIYLTGTLNAGYDNILVNDDDLAGGSIQVETERVDVIWYQGIQTSSPSTAVFPVIERGGNDNIAIAAITSLNTDGTPATYGTVIGIPETFWPSTGSSFNNYLILRRETAGVEPIPLLNIGTIAGQDPQVVQGVAVSFTELGISANQSVYGYSLFSADVCDGFTSDTNDVLSTGSQTIKSGIDLSDISTFPDDTKSDDSGLDLVAGVSAAVASDDNLIETKGPGGYKPALATWLKANDGAFVSDGGATSTEGNNVGFWEDQSAGNHDFTTLGTAPTFRSTTSSINFNPTVDFLDGSETGLQVPDNEDYNVKSVNSGYERKSMNIAFRTPDSEASLNNKQQLFEQGGGTNGLGIYIRAGNLHMSVWNKGAQAQGDWNDSGTAAQTISVDLDPDTEYIVTLEFVGDPASAGGGSITGYLNGQQFGILTAPFSQNIGLLYNHGGDVGFGQHDGASLYDDNDVEGDSFYGEISEFIYCNEPGAIISGQRNRIESYLAIKYGITLDQSTALNYYNSNGDIIFNTTQNAALGGFLEYNNDIAGIGRDDASELDQSASRSENEGSVVTIDRGSTISTNDAWLIWGNDGAALTETIALTMPDTIESRLSRVWRVGEEKEVLTTSVSFDLTSLGLSSDPNDFSLLIAGNSTNADFSNATVITGGTFNGNTITFTGVNLDDGQYFTLGTEFFQCFPGGVESSLVMWLRANSGTNTTTNGATVTSWDDQAGTNNAVGTDPPLYNTSGLNFNPTIDFTAANENYMIIAHQAAQTTDEQALFVVGSFTSNSVGYSPFIIKTTDWNWSNGWGLGTDEESDVVLYHKDAWSGAGSMAQQTMGYDSPAINISRTDATTHYNNLNLGTDDTETKGARAASTDDITIGASPDGVVQALPARRDFLDGSIGEIIMFSDDLTATERQQIASYLAIKYGITLDQTSGQDYLNSVGTTIWDATTNSTYNNDIAGIGRDDASCLEQKQSTSQNDNTIVTMGLGTISASNAANPNNFTDDGDFLIWGNDGDFADQANANTADVPGIITERMERIWKVEDSGNTGATTIQFDINGLGYSSNVSDFNLIISNSATMSAGSITPAASLVGGILTFNNVDLTDGQFFTIGTDRDQCGPGGISTDLELWLRADAEVFNTGTTPATDGQTVNSWADQSVSAANATDPSNLTTYETNTVNFNPAVQFAQDATSLEGSFTTTTAGLTMFTSAFYNSTSVNNDAIFEVNGPGGGSANRSFFADQRYGGTNTFSPTITEDSWNFWSIDHPSGSTANIFENGASLVSSYNTNLSVAGTGTYEYTLGDDDTGGQDFTGFIGDLIVYQGTMTTTERRQVETYLAIKYGITIDQSSATDYIWSDGSTVIWDATANAGYNEDIAGIGRDDNSCFSQKQSTSINTDDILTIGLGSVAASNADNVNSFDESGDYLIWGNDGGATAQAGAETSDVPSSITERVTRIWRVDDTGAVGNTEIQFDLSGLGYSSNEDDFALLVGNTATMADATVITGGSINDDILSFSDIDLTDGQYFTIATAFATCGPGGVNTNISLWVRADKEVYTDAGSTLASDGNDIQQWNDQSSPQINASLATLGGAGPIEPTLQTSEINFNPIVRITDPNSSNASYLQTSSTPVTGDFTMISLFKTGQSSGTDEDVLNSPVLISSRNAGSLDHAMGMQSGTIWVHADSDNGFEVQSSSTYNSNSAHFATAIKSGTSLSLFVDSNADGSGTATNTLSNATGFGIGNHFNADLQAQFAGDIAETIVFSEALDSEERNRVESYLALKYGLTKAGTDDGGTASVDERDYRAGDGGVIWDYDGQGATYYNEIFGIGRDDLSCLEQVTSKSENNDAIVTFNLPGGFGNNDSFILSGNDNAAIENPNNREFNSSQVKSRLNREWKVQETGTVGTIEVTFDLDDVTGPLGVGTNNLSQVRLMVDDDGDFTSGATLITPTSFNGSNNTVTFTVDFTDGQYYTLGSEEVAALPVELISFSAKVLENNNVRLNWSTASEENNEYFTIERSQDGRTFESIGTIEGALSSNGIQTYQFIDFEPLTGYSYYRLKQNDISGDFEYSDIKAVHVETEFFRDYLLYPNPTSKGSPVNIRYRINENKLIYISIFNTKGILLYQEERVLSVRESSFSLPTSNLSIGINLIKITDQDKRSTSLKLAIR